MKINKSQKRLLFEAFRRNEMNDSHEQTKPLNERWLGLGTKAAYRPVLDAGLMTWHNDREPFKRCMGWLVLTEKGIEVLNYYSPEFKEVLEEMNKVGYQKSYLANYTLAGGFTAN